MNNLSDKNWLENKYLVEQLSVPEIAKLTGCAYGTVQYWMRKYKIHTRSKILAIHTWHKKQLENELYIDSEWLRKKYWDEGLDIGQIGKIANCSGVTILRWMQKFNIPRRTKSEITHAGWVTGGEERLQKVIKGMKAAYSRGVFTSKEYKESISKAARANWEKGIYSGEKHPRWLGDTIERDYPLTFNEEFKSMIRQRDNYKCAVCRFFGKEVHHINYIKSDTTLKNCITLCKKCHMHMHGNNRNYWQLVLSKLVDIRNSPNGG